IETSEIVAYTSRVFAIGNDGDEQRVETVAVSLGLLHDFLWICKTAPRQSERAWLGDSCELECAHDVGSSVGACSRLHRKIFPSRLRNVRWITHHELRAFPHQQT